MSKGSQWMRKLDLEIKVSHSSLFTFPGAILPSSSTLNLRGRFFFFPGKGKEKEFLPNPLLSSSSIYNNYPSLNICCVSGTVLAARDVDFNCM